MADISNYRAWKAKQQQNGVGAAEVVLGSTTDTPDQIADDMNLANDYGKITGAPVPPVPMVKEYRPTFQAAIEREQQRAVLAKSPRLAEWLRNPDNAGLAKDDLNNLSWMEGFGRGVSNVVDRAVERDKQIVAQIGFEGAAQRIQDRDRNFSQILRDQTKNTSPALRDMAGRPIETFPGPLDVAGAFMRWGQARISETFGIDEQAAAEMYGQKLGETKAAFEAKPKSGVATAFEGEAFQDYKSLGEGLAGFSTAIVNNPVGAFSWMLETAGESAPVLAGSVAVTAATRNPMAGAGVMGFGSYTTERYVSPMEFYAEKGLDMSKPEDTQKLLSNPEWMREAADRSVIRAIVVSGFDMASLGLAGRSLAGNPFVEMIAQTASQAIIGGAGEYTARLAAGQDTDWNEVLGEALGGMATTPVDMAIAGRRVQVNRTRARDAETRQAMFQELSGQAQSSALRARMPDKFRQFVEQATANGPVENLYIPADQFNTYFQSVGVDPFALVDELDGVSREDFETAIATGGDLQIPTATYAAKIAGSEHDAFLMQNMTFDPMQMSGVEAANFDVNAAMQEAWETAEAQRIEDEASRSYEQEIRETVISRMRAAGEALDVAGPVAETYVSFYQTRAERAGMTTEEFLRAYPLPEFRGAIPEGMKLKDVTAFDRTLAELRGRRNKAQANRGPSLLEFISERGGMVDPGGELRARDAEVIRRPGKKNLKLSRTGFMSGVRDMIGGATGFGIDDVAVAAIEAGYLADDPVANEYRAALAEGRQVPDVSNALLAAIDRELAGEGQFSGNAPESRDADLDQIEAYLDTLGLTLEADDATIRAAVQQDNDGRQYAQPLFQSAQVATTQTAAFKNWFGKSKVVDSRGRPRVVYHGTASDFSSFDPARGGSNTRDVDAAGGFFFSSSADIADGYSTLSDGNSNIMPVYLSIENPYVADMHGAPYDAGVYQQIIATAKAEGNDGVILNNVRDGVYDDSPRSGIFVAFKPEQIKSATGNRGTFDPASGNILYQTSREAIRINSEFDLTNVKTGSPVTFDFAHNTESATDLLGIPERGAPFDRGLEPSGRYVVVVPDASKVDTSGRMIAGTLKFLNPLVMDVETWKKDLHGKYGLSGKALSKAIISDGYDGVITISNDTRPGRSHIAEVLDLTTFDEARALYQGDGNKRGSVLIPSAGIRGNAAVVNFFQAKDLSTALHESGHIFLEVMRDLSERGDAESVRDFTVVKDWWRQNAADVARDAMKASWDVKVTAADVIAALDNGTTGDVTKDLAIDVGMQEQMARGLEGYFLEGRAPSADLRSVFETFRAWMISIYQRLAGLDVQLNDEIRGVFDRMLASDAQIAEARADIGDTSLFATAEEMGLTPQEFEAFSRLRVQSQDDAKARLLREAMAPVRRDREKWYRDEKEKVRGEVEARVNAFPMYRALEWMANRRWLGEGQPENMPDIRMSKDILVERYGEGVLKTLPRGRQTMYAVEGGIDPDDAAGWFGYDSGDALVKALEQAPPRREAISAETEAQMRERHGDPLRDGSIEAEAMDAVHNDKRGQWIAAELKAVAEVARVEGVMTMKQAREVARQTTSRMKVRDATNSNRFLAAERKAAAEATTLGRVLAREGVWMNAARRRIATKTRAAVAGAGTIDAVARQAEQATASTENYNETVGKLIAAKQRQLMNHALYMESRAVAEEVGKAERLAARLRKRSTRERIAGAGRRDNAEVDYLAAIDEIMTRYDFRKSSGAADERQGALVALLENLKALGRDNEIAIPEVVRAAAKRKPYKTVPVEELRGVVDSLKNLEHMARNWDKLISEKRERDFQDEKDKIVNAIKTNLKSTPEMWVKQDGLRSDAKEGLNGYLATFQTATAIIRQMDAREDIGPVYDALKSDIDDAAYTERVMRKEATKEIENLYSVYSKDEQREMGVRRVYTELGDGSFSKWNLIAMALNMGNVGNLHRLTNRDAKMHLTADQVEALKGILTEKDWKFVQSVWDYLNTFQPKMAERQRRVVGVEPKWVEATPVVTPYGTFKGGYYPIKYDNRLGGGRLQMGDTDAEILQSMIRGGYVSAATKDGHLQARSESVNQSLSLDVSIIGQHVSEVIHDLTFSEAVVNTFRLLSSNEVRDAMVEAGMDKQHDALRLWVIDAASGQVAADAAMGRIFQKVRAGFSYSKLAWNVKTMLLQPLGVFQSSVAVGKKNMARSMVRYLANPKAMSDDVFARSKMMWERRDTFNKDLMDVVAKSNIASPSRGKVRDAFEDYVIPAGMAGIQYTQLYTVDIPTWAAAFQKGLKKFKGDQDKAAQYADMTVNRTQGSGIWSDRSGIERGTLSMRTRQSPFVMLFTTLGSYFFAKMNMMIERTQAVRSEPVTVMRAMDYAMDMMMLLAAEAAVITLLGLAFGDDEDDDGNPVGDIGLEAFKTFIAGLPVARDIAGMAGGFSPGTYASILGTVWEPMKQAYQGEFDKAAVKSTVNLGGMLFRLPSSQTNRIIDAAWREAEGEDVPVLEYLMGRKKK